MKWLTRALAAVVLTAAGCGTDLGDCDMAALTMAPGTPVYEGQLLVHQTCASGQCHSLSATGEARNGAPAGLDFDLIMSDASQGELSKVTRGEAHVDEAAEEMWEWIDEGTMPPEGQRMPLEGAHKESVRNWLACGAPVIKQPIATPVGADWAQIFPQLETTCRACHDSMGVATGPWLVVGNACATRTNLIATAAVGTECVGRGTLIVPNDPDASVLLQKLELPMPCGMVMPPGRAPAAPSGLAGSIRSWITAGAMAPDCP